MAEAAENQERITVDDLRGDLPADELCSRFDRDYGASDSYFSGVWQSKWAEAIKHWQGEHLKVPRTGRSKLFLRKPRADSEAIKGSVIEAFFSSQDIVTVEPGRKNVPQDVIAAKIRQAWLAYRLDSNPIQFYKIVHSACDDAVAFNLVGAYVDWEKKVEIIDYIEKKKRMRQDVNALTGQPMQWPEVDPQTGEPVIDEIPAKYENVLKNAPAVTLLPPELFKLDPRADWIDYFEKAQYLIVDWYMAYQDLFMAAKQDPLIDMKAVDDCPASARKLDFIATTRDPYQLSNFAGNDRKEILVSDYWYKIQGKWWHAWINEKTRVIRKPEICMKAHGEPCYEIGFLTPESHRSYSDSLLTIHKDYYIASNGIVNQRFDNVALIMNKHLFVNREAQVDTESIINRRPGGYTEGNGDPRLWTHWDQVPDLGASAYNEQVLVDRERQESTGVTDMDQGVKPQGQELATQSVIRTQKANKKQAVLIKTFAESFVKRVVKKLLMLADQFETDQVIMQIVGMPLALEMVQAGINLGEANDQIPPIGEIKGQYNIKVYAGMGSVPRDVKVQNQEVAIKMTAEVGGPTAVIPLLPEFYSLVGVKNIDEVMMAVKGGIMQQLVAELKAQQQGQQPGGGNGKVSRETIRPEAKTTGQTMAGLLRDNASL